MCIARKTDAFGLPLNEVLQGKFIGSFGIQHVSRRKSWRLSLPIAANCAGGSGSELMLPIVAGAIGGRAGVVDFALRLYNRFAFVELEVARFIPFEFDEIQIVKLCFSGAVGIWFSLVGA